MVFKSAWDNDLILSDLHLPYENLRARNFVKQVKKEFRIADDRCYSVGDFIDEYHGGQWEKDPDAIHTPKTEILDTQRKIKDWFKIFPALKIARGNHETRWMRKAYNAGIPSMMIKTHRAVLDLPDSWQYAEKWTVKGKHVFDVEHGDSWGGQLPHKQAILHKARSTVIGHWHSLGGVEYIDTLGGRRLWGAVSSCLVDNEAYVYHYAKKAKLKFLNGLIVVMNSGQIPLYVPMD